MRDLQAQVRISSCLAYFNRLLMSLPISNLTPLESKGHQPTSQLRHHFNHVTIYCKHHRLTLILWAVEGEPFMKVSQVFIFCFCSMWTLSTIRLISPTPTDDLLKLSAHPGFLVKARMPFTCATEKLLIRFSVTTTAANKLYLQNFNNTHILSDPLIRHQIIMSLTVKLLYIYDLN